jgi:hypothetical protein
MLVKNSDVRLSKLTIPNTWKKKRGLKSGKANVNADKLKHKEEYV